MKQNYDSIDLIKFIACIFIVALHANALYDINTVLNVIVCEGIARLGVPFFFTASAFFFFRKPLIWEGTRKYCKRLLTLYMAWFIVSIPKTIFDRFVCSPYPLGETIFRFIRSFFVTSTFSGSWFIASCVFCALFFYLLEKLDDRKRRVVTIALSAIIYFWITFTSAYGRLIGPLGLSIFYAGYELILANPYCSIIVGIPYFALGRYYASRAEGGYYSKVHLFGLLAGISLALLLSEVYLVNAHGLAKSTDCYFMLLPCIFFLFPVILHCNIKLKRPIFLRIASTVIFFSQFWLLFFCEFVEWAVKVTIPWLLKFGFALLGGILLTLFILRCQEKKWFHWLRYLY
ncbi:MAG: acyltransferase family protein [Thermoguttaceae bacterium]|nr:acyltransferase family protein [Thermoguttaceae bacterium]